MMRQIHVFTYPNNMDIRTCWLFKFNIHSISMSESLHFILFLFWICPNDPAEARAKILNIQISEGKWPCQQLNKPWSISDQQLNWNKCPLEIYIWKMVSFNGYIKNHQRVHSQIFTTTVVFLFIHQGLSGAPFHVGPPFKFCRNFSGLFIIFCAPFHVGSCHRTSGPMWNPRMTFSKWGTSGSSYVCFEALSMFPYPLMVKQAIKHTHTQHQVSHVV